MTTSTLDFATDFALREGHYVVEARANAIARQKLDKSAVTDADEAINNRFIDEVRSEYGNDAAVTGEEASTGEGVATRVATSRMLWVIDPIDGTGEYIDTTIADADRTSCIGISLFMDGIQQLSVVFNPFRQELFTAENHDNYAYLNGEKLTVENGNFDDGLVSGMPYDYCHWDGCLVDVRFLNTAVGPRRHGYSAISQACDVARGESAFAISPWHTIHDIAPGALLVMKAGGIVGDTFGYQLHWDDLSSGVIYAATSQIYTDVVSLINTRR